MAKTIKPANPSCRQAALLSKTFCIRITKPGKDMCKRAVLAFIGSLIFAVRCSADIAPDEYVPGLTGWPAVAATPPSWILLGLMSAASYELSLTPSPTPVPYDHSASADTLAEDYSIQIRKPKPGFYVVLPNVSRMPTIISQKLNIASGQPGGIAGWCTQPQNRSRLSISCSLPHR